MFGKRTMFAASVAVLVVALLVEPTGALLIPTTHLSTPGMLRTITVGAARRQKRQYCRHKEDRIGDTAAVERMQCSMTTPPSAFPCSTTTRNEAQRGRRRRTAVSVGFRCRWSQSNPAATLSRVGARGTARWGSRSGAVSDEDSEASNTGNNGTDGEEEPIKNSGEMSSSASKVEGFVVDGIPTSLSSTTRQEDKNRLPDVAAINSGTTENAEDTDSSSSWWPRLFPPASSKDGALPDDGALIELPLDGVLLQLFPALLIGVLGLILTVAVQLEASRFDGMVGEDGGAVVVTDLRAPRNPQQ